MCKLLAYLAILTLCLPGWWQLGTCPVSIVRPHVKFLAGDYLCFDTLAHDRGVQPYCRLCQLLTPHPAPSEDYEHILTRCRATADTRGRILPQLLNTISDNLPSNWLLSSPAHNLLTQFILDCCSLNLPRRFNINDHDSQKIFQLSRDLCYYIRKTRTEKLRLLSG